MINSGSEMVRAKFTIEGSGLELDGIHDPHETWNGWATPFLTLESTIKVEKWIGGLELEGELPPIYFDGFTVQFDGTEVSPNSFDGFTVERDGHEVYESFYDIGRHGWVYEVVSE
jgi:hypothetical protein